MATTVYETANCGVAHRDLKPSNILISDKSFLQLSDWDPTKGAMWRSAPCVAKLTDFGQSWGNICQTSMAGRTHTINVFQGTIAFMAPEIINPKQRPFSINQEGMKKADIWSLGAVLHCLINPSCQIPYVKEARRDMAKDIKQYITEKVSAGTLPESSDGYEWQHATLWLPICDAVLACMKKVPSDRPAAEEVLQEEQGLSEDYPLNCHQGTALNIAQDSSLEDGVFLPPSNDGSNACIFLALKIAEHLLLKKEKSWQDIKQAAEEIITTFPTVLNEKRRKEEMYSLQEAFALLESNDLISEGNYSYVGKGYEVFSEDGRKELETHLETAAENTVSIITVTPYSFIMGKHLGKWFVLDTHVICHGLGGDGNGILKVFQSPHLAARWGWRRLVQSDVKSGYQEIVDISFEVRQGQSERSEADHPEKTNNSADEKDQIEILGESQLIDSLENADDISMTILEGPRECHEISSRRVVGGGGRGGNCPP